MKQLVQNMGSGETALLECPDPAASSGKLIVQTTRSLISVGTEKMLVDFGKASLVNKARQQPEKVKMVLDKVATDGLITTVDAVRTKLADPLPLGYSAVGVVSSACGEFAVGDRVVTNGAHADWVKVSPNLAAKIPDNVSDEEASFTVVASIGLQGIRLAQPTLGEFFVVTGAGLIGLLTAQLLIAQGCSVMAVDFDESKLEAARRFGAHTCNAATEDVVAKAMALTNGIGVDGVIITASTKSSEPVSDAANMCRKLGRIVLVGVTGLELNRAEFYDKELTFQVSCSYGPGRYDPNYEDKLQDYPIGYVRWTQQRNFEAVLKMMSTGKLEVASLITHRFDFDDAINAYEVLSAEPALGVILQYPQDVTPASKIEFAERQGQAGPRSVSFIGSGNYATRMLIPAFKKAEADLDMIASSGGMSAGIHGSRLGFRAATTDLGDLFTSNTAAIAIATRHDTHAPLAIRGLESGKHVFVEKPLAITQEQLDAVKQALHDNDTGMLMVGFNRRFSPQIQTVKHALNNASAPKSIIMTMNAGTIPADHWVHDMQIGGGRIIGEACHHIDLMRFLVGHDIVDHSIQSMATEFADKRQSDCAIITLRFADGSVGSVHYLANGGSKFPKERVEVFCNGATLVVDNFRKLKSYGWKGVKDSSLLAQDKGQAHCAKAFMDAVENGGPAPIPLNEIIEVAQISLDLVNELAE